MHFIVENVTNIEVLLTYDANIVIIGISKNARVTIKHPLKKIIPSVCLNLLDGGLHVTEIVR